MNSNFDAILQGSFLRTIIFLLIFISMALTELWRPRRHLTINKSWRWFSNIAVHLINIIILYIIFPVMPIGVAVFCAENGWGIMNYFHLPVLLSGIIGIIALDFTIYLQHVMLHYVPLLWRLHMMHHLDQDIDVTTAIRFHPLEIILSTIIKLCIVLFLGPPAIAVLIFEIILNGAAMFNHSNINIPKQADGIIRLVMVTPDMHRVHHSIIREETNSNYGFSVSWWDRIFGTYRAQPALGHDNMTVGLQGYQDARYSRLFKMLTIPFVSK